MEEIRTEQEQRAESGTEQNRAEQWSRERSSGAGAESGAVKQEQKALEQEQRTEWSRKQIGTEWSKSGSGSGTEQRDESKETRADSGRLSGFR